MSDVMIIHRQTCPNFNNTLDLSLDGVQESKSSSVSLDVYSVSFKSCKNVYPIKIIRPNNKYKVDDQMFLKAIIDDITSNGCIIDSAIFDNPKRSFVRCALCHSSSFACEYCESKAEYIRDIIKGQQPKGHLAWPFSTHDGPLRTREKIIEITQRIENGDVLTREEAKGFYGTSHLLYQNNFDFIKCITVEYMHSTCLGVVKRLISLTFNVGETRKRVTTRKLSDVSVFNKLISEVQVVREFSRRLRNLDFGVMKAQEFRNIILFFFILVVECIQDEFPREKKVWLQLAFVIRSCVIPNKEFYLIADNVIQKTALSFYQNYEAIYGPKNCTYSVHVVPSHILAIRGDEPLTEKSAFKYENFYSELRNLYQPGTLSTTKQMLSNCYMKRQLEKHNCQKSIHYDIEKQGKENNSLVYYMDQNNKYQFFKIIKVHNNGNVTCNPQGRQLYNNDLVKNLKWEQVGVFKLGPFSNEEIILPIKKIEGKAIKVKNLLITCPNNVLREQ